MMNKITGIVAKLTLSLLLLLNGIPGLRAQEFPDPVDPPRMVNDFAGFLDPGEAGLLDKKLQDFYYRSSTQIYIVTVADLFGYDPGDYASRLGEKWGVGTKGKDNGIVILVKPKTGESRGEVFISTGYGLEGAVPDALANRIVDNEILPRFRENDNFGGLDRAADVIISLTEGEYTADEYIKRTESSGGGGIAGIIILIILLAIIFGGRSGTKRHNHLGRDLPFWLLLSMLNSGSRSHGGSFGGFSREGGGFGGFGGGGGGSFGGGGAGGSW